MSTEFFRKASDRIEKRNTIERELYSKFDVKLGLRNNDGSGVLAGLTKLSSVIGTEMSSGKILPAEGKLYYRGIDLLNLANGILNDNKHAYAEVTYLLLFGELPTMSELEEFENELSERYELPEGFTETNILLNSSPNVMTQSQRLILALYNSDPEPENISISNVLRQSLEPIADFPAIVAYAYIALRHKFYGEPLLIHSPQKKFDIASNFLYMLPPEGKFSLLEAQLLDLALILHAEHGGGNNISFTMHVVTSSHAETYTSFSADLVSLKGSLHGAANANVMDMMRNIKDNSRDWTDQEEVAAYIEKILMKQAHNRTGLVYGMGHAAYAKSDPRAVILKQ